MLARTCSGFYMPLLFLSHSAEVAALRRVGFRLLRSQLRRTPTSSWKYCRMRLRRHAFSEQNCTTAFSSSSCRSATQPRPSPPPTRFSSSSRLIMNAIALLGFTPRRSPTRPLGCSTPPNPTAARRAPRVRSPSVHRRRLAYLVVVIQRLRQIPVHHQPHVVLLSTLSRAAHFVDPHSERDRRHDHATPVFGPALQRLFLLLPLFLTRSPRHNAQRPVIHRRREALAAQKLPQPLRVVFLPH